MALDAGTGARLIELKDRIAKHYRESEWLELGTLTDEFDLVNNHYRLLRSMRFGDDDYEGHALSVLRTMVENEPGNLARISEYVERKFPSEEGENVSSEKRAGRRIVFAPSVFEVPEVGVDKCLVSVMMPFDSAFSSVYQSVKDAATEARLTCQRADDIWEHSVVIQDIFSLIFRSFIVVCDFTGRNANVFYEAGIAHTLGKHVVPITQHAGDIPFDVKHHRYLVYNNNGEGREKLKTELAKRLTTLTSSEKLPVLF